jgi:hypothetical protein
MALKLTAAVAAARRAARSQLQRLDHTAEKVWEMRLRPGGLPGRGEMTALLRRNGLGTFSEYVHLQMTGPGPRNFLPTDRDRFVKEVNDNWPESVPEILSVAEAVMAGRLSLFGHKDVLMARRPRPSLRLAPEPARLDWRKDPITGKSFPRRFSEWRWDPVRMSPLGADVKGPWEVTRCQHLVTLGQAYWLTSDERFARCYALTVADFIEHNPVRLGVHWACNMDVSLRVVGWLAALGFFQGSSALDRRWWELFCRTIVAHGRYMLAHLEFGTLDGRIVTSNHYLANVFGLHWLALNFPGLDAGAVWRGTAERALETECQRQVCVDGGPFESSVAYLRLVLEMLLSAWALSEHAGHPLSDLYRQRLAAGFEFLVAIRQEGGRLPQIGDADDGRAHIFTQYGTWPAESADWLLVAGAHVMGRPDWAEGIGFSYHMEKLFWGEGAPAYVAHDLSASQRSVRLFPTSGIAVIRDGHSQAVLANTPIGTEGFGNHKHNDQLSLEWFVGRQPLLADPGTYIYTQDPETRNLLRSTAAHTTVMVDGEEQHELRPELLFRLFARGTGDLEAREQGVSGSQSTYERLGVSHRRRVSLIGDGVLVVDDFFTGSSGHLLEWTFALYPGVDAIMEQGRAVLRGPNGAGCLWTGDIEMLKEEFWYSPGYGRRLPTTRLRTARRDGPQRVTWVLAPVDAEIDLVTAAKVADVAWGQV